MRKRKPNYQHIADLEAELFPPVSGSRRRDPNWRPMKHVDLGVVALHRRLTGEASELNYNTVTLSSFCESPFMPPQVVPRVILPSGTRTS